jgi:hypothetical protein
MVYVTEKQAVVDKSSARSSINFCWARPFGSRFRLQLFLSAALQEKGCLPQPFARAFGLNIEFIHLH